MTSNDVTLLLALFTLRTVQRVKIKTFVNLDVERINNVCLYTQLGSSAHLLIFVSKIIYCLVSTIIGYGDGAAILCSAGRS